MAPATLLSPPNTFHYFFHGFQVTSPFDLGIPQSKITAAAVCTVTCLQDTPVKSEPFWVCSFSLSDGTPKLSLYAIPEGMVLRVARVGDFSIIPSGIGVFPSGDIAPASYLLGRVFVLWLELFHFPVLHGATLRIGNEAWGFLGHSGAGKSTLTGYLNAKKHLLITDDLIPLEQQDNQYIVQPGIPISRMWPEFGRELYGSAFEGFPKVHKELEKRRIPRTVSGRDRFSSEAFPLTRLFILERSAQTETPSYQPLPPAQALVHCAHLSSVHLELEALQLHAKRLKGLAQLVEHTQIGILRYGNGLTALADVAALLEEQMCRQTSMALPT